jgi:hypothetical protein
LTLTSHNSITIVKKPGLVKDGVEERHGSAGGMVEHEFLSTDHERNRLLGHQHNGPTHSLLGSAIK